MNIVKLRFLGLFFDMLHSKERIKWSKATRMRCHEGAVIASCSIFELPGKL